jgi:hypothetical protein
MTGAPAFHPFYGDDGQQIGWQSEDLATVVGLDQLPPGYRSGEPDPRAVAGQPSPPPAAPPSGGNLLDFFAGNQAQAATPPPAGFDTPVPRGSSALPPGFDTPVPYAEYQQSKEEKKPEPAPDRGALGAVSNFVGGVADAAAQGASFGFADELGAGMRALVRGGTNLIQGKDADLGGSYDRALADIRGRDKQFAEEHPVASMVGNVAGGLALGNLGGKAVSTVSSMPRNIAKGAGTGAAYGALNGFGAGEGGLDNRLEAAGQGAMMGGGLGAAVPLAGATVARVISPVRNRLTPEQQRLAGVAKTEGIPLTAAQATGSRPLNNVESTFGTLPLTAGPQQAVGQAQRVAFNRAALRHIGETGDSLAPDVLLRARQRIGGDFNKLAAQTTVDLDVPFVTKITDVANEYDKLLEVQKKPIFEKFVREILAVGTDMKGTVYQKLRSDLGRMAKNYRKNDPTLAEALRGLRDALDDAADRSVPPPLKGEWDKARLEYSNLKTLEKAMSNTTAGAAAGNLQPTQLAQAVSQQYPEGYGLGYGPMNDLSKVGTSFVRDNVPNSGTAERSLMTSLLTGGPVGAGGATAYFANPLAGAAIAGTGLALPRVAQALYNSRPGQAYFRNQAAANAVPKINQGLLAAVLAGTAGGGLLGQ